MKDCAGLAGLWTLKSKSSAIILIILSLITPAFFWIKCMTPPTSFMFQKYPRYLPF